MISETDAAEKNHSRGFVTDNPDLKPSKYVSDVELSRRIIEEVETSIKIMARLRRADGCPWDIAQTRQTLLKNLLEETYEFIYAAGRENRQEIIEELGDLLLQVLIQSQVASDNGEFDLGDVAETLNKKLIRRHPHVFGNVEVNSQQEALASWNTAKRTEGAHTVNPSDVPADMPALMRARKVVDKAGKVGFEWPDVQGAMEKLDEEITELRQAIAGGNKKHAFEELGDVLFMTACVARYLDECPELALQGTIDKFLRRFRHIEKRLAENGKTPETSNLAEMDSYWDEAKGMEGE